MHKPGGPVSPYQAADFVDLLEGYRSGNREAANELMHILYPELRRIAVAHLGRERPEHSWQPTALLNELYLELRKIRKLRRVTGESDRAAFLAFASHLMKRLLIHHARPLSQRVDRMPLDVGDEQADVSSDSWTEVELILSRLETLDTKLRVVVELKVFGGLTEPEIALKLGCAPRTVARYWQFARQWLRRELCGDETRG